MEFTTPTIIDVRRMVFHLEEKISNGTASPKLLETMQIRLDTIDKNYLSDSDPEKRYHQLLELQALIYGQQGKDEKAQHFMDAALQSAGNANALTSKLLKEFIFRNSNPEQMEFFCISP